jgi:hypothetical protein
MSNNKRIGCPIGFLWTASTSFLLRTLSTYEGCIGNLHEIHMYP